MLRGWVGVSPLKEVFLKKVLLDKKDQGLPNSLEGLLVWLVLLGVVGGVCNMCSEMIVGIK